MPIPEAATLDAARAFLADRYGETATDIAPAGAGEWSVAYAFRREGRDYVARLGAHIGDFEMDRVAASHASSGLPIPRVLEIGDALGAHYAISERVFGAYLDQLDGDAMRATLPGLFVMLDALRGANVSHSRGYGSWDATGDAPHATWSQLLLALPDDAPGSRIGGWRAKLARSAAASAFDEAYAALATFAGRCPIDRYLVHNDTLNRNVFVHEGRISGLIDWGCGMYGDFVYDIALLAMWWPWFPAWNDIDIVAEAERHYGRIGLHVPRFRERLRCYLTHIGVVHIIYTAHMDRPADLARITQETLEHVAMPV